MCIPLKHHHTSKVRSSTLWFSLKLLLHLPNVFSKIKRSYIGYNEAKEYWFNQMKGKGKNKSSQAHRVRRKDLWRTLS